MELRKEGYVPFKASMGCGLAHEQKRDRGVPAQTRTCLLCGQGLHLQSPFVHVHFLFKLLLRPFQLLNLVTSFLIIYFLQSLPLRLFPLYSHLIRINPGKNAKTVFTDSGPKV